jgi:Sulfite exporter TauE/SafE.
MTPEVLAVAAGAVAIGAFIQGSVGFGFSLFAAPILAVIDRAMVPGPMVFLVMALTIAMAGRERRWIDVRELRWALVGRFPGAVLGALAVAAVTERVLTFSLVVLVLGTVLMSLTKWHLSPTIGVLMSAGAVSGFMGTVSSIDGPPIALVYQRASGPRLRANLAGYFSVGSVLSLATLILFGEFGSRQLLTACLLLPAVAVGLAASRHLTCLLDRGHTRRAVLVVSTFSSILLLVRELA